MSSLRSPLCWSPPTQVVSDGVNVDGWVTGSGAEKAGIAKREVWSVQGRFSELTLSLQGGPNWRNADGLLLIWVQRGPLRALALAVGLAGLDWCDPSGTGGGDPGTATVSISDEPGDGFVAEIIPGGAATVADSELLDGTIVGEARGPWGPA